MKSTHSFLTQQNVMSHKVMPFETVRCCPRYYTSVQTVVVKWLSKYFLNLSEKEKYHWITRLSIPSTVFFLHSSKCCTDDDVFINKLIKSTLLFFFVFF